MEEVKKVLLHSRDSQFFRNSRQFSANAKLNPGYFNLEAIS